MKKCCTVLLMAALSSLVSGCEEEDPVVSHSSTKGIDRPAETACTVFAAHYRQTGTDAARLRLADEVVRHAGRSDNGAVAGRAGLVGRSANRGDDSWREASRSLLTACREAGWKP